MSNKIPMDYLSFDCEKKHLLMNTFPSTTSLVLVPRLIALEKISIELEVTLTDVSNTMKIILKGNWKISDVDINMEISYYRNTGEYKLYASPPNNKLSLTKLARDVTGIKSIPSALLGRSKGLVFTGLITRNNLITLTLTSDKGSTKIYVIYQRDGSSKPSIAIAVEIPRFKLSRLISSLIPGVHISNVPYFGTLEVKDIAMTTSTGEIEDLPEDTFANSKLLKKNGETIERGIKAFVTFSFYEDPIVMHYNNKILELETISKKFSLKRLFHSIEKGNKKLTVILPTKLKDIFDFNVDKFSISGRDQTTTIDVSYPRKIKLFKNLLVISDVIVYLTIANRRPKLTAETEGIINLAGDKFETTLKLNQKNKYVLTARGDKLSVTKLLHTIGSTFLPNPLNTLLKRTPFFNFVIVKPVISYTFGSKPMLLHLSGKPTINGFTIADIDIVIMKVKRRTKVIVGYEIGRVNIAKFLTRITRFNFKRFPLLNQDLDVTLMVSPVDAPNVHFERGKLRGLTINKGISIQASMGFPRDCSSDKFCKVAMALIGKNAKMTLQGTINSIHNYPLTASVSSIRIGKKIKLVRAGLRIVGGATPSIGIVGAIDLKKPPITLSAEISVSTKGIALELSMTNCWKNSFGVKWLSVCNLLGSIAFAPNTGVSGLELGGEIRLGYVETGKQIRARGYIGINTLTPVENYYYVKFNRITTGSLLRAFKVNIRLPKPLAESGFPKGFLSSFSLIGKELPQVHVSIPQGYRLKGTINILGLEGMADVTLNIPKGVDYKISLPPIKVGSILKMYASPREKSKGPFLRVKVQVLPRPLVHIEAKGYLMVLGISIETRLKITNRQYEFFIQGKILHLFQASLHITANYGSISKAHFRVRGQFKMDLFQRIQKTITGTLDRSAKKATGAIKAAIRKVNRQKVHFDRAIRKLQHANNKVNALKHKFDKAANKVRRVRDRLIRKCKIRRCERGE